MTTVEDFLTLSATLTGYSPAELRATGMAEEYRRVAGRYAGPGSLERLSDALAGTLPPRFDDEAERRLAAAVAHLWYLGSGSWAVAPEVCG
ncbi:hypothetical protein AB0K51_29185 [Kitasatospora sp. NPDC049285]|uniref:hypothetical protein n=1 Tax=Kitasatospora sp. NPDC049285 TaxID=3157096 RepID=UPI00344AD1E7